MIQKAGEYTIRTSIEIAYC